MAEKIVENELGMLEFRDEKTGEVTATQKPSPRQRKKINAGKPIRKKTKHELVETENGKMVADPETVPTVGRQRGRVVYPYNVDTCTAIIQSVAEGMTLRQISEMTGMPPVPTIHYWIAKYKEFKHDMEIAKKIRGEAFAEEAIDISRNTNAMKSRADKLKIDTLKWAAKVNNPEQFSDTVKHTGDANNPIQIIVDTGIRRKTDE